MKKGEQPVQGTVRKASVSLKLGFSGNDYGYAIDLGLPSPSSSHFCRDPEIKAESQWIGETLTRFNVFAARNGPSVRIRDEAGAWRQVFAHLAPFDSMMTHCSDPREAPELLLLRERMRDWRFYDHFRTDRDAPARRPQIGTYTPVLGSDGSDLAAAIQTIREIGNPAELDGAVGRCFSGMQDRHHDQRRPFRIADEATWAAAPTEGGRAFRWHAPLSAADRRAAVAAPADLMILNEPETSLHPDLLPPLARLIAQAAQRTQIIVVSHAATLVSALETAPQARRIVLEKHLGETLVQPDKRPAWTWPSR